MINTAQALYEFWAGFDLPAYTISTVPDDVELPYITYSLVESEPLEPVTHYAQVWYRDSSNRDLLEKVDEIKQAIGTGVVIDCEGGHVVLRPSTPLIQIQTDENPENRYAYVNLQLNCYHE